VVWRLADCARGGAKCDVELVVAQHRQTLTVARVDRNVSLRVYGEGVPKPLTVGPAQQTGGRRQLVNEMTGTTSITLTVGGLPVGSTACGSA
jgi:hypothetical protein